MQHTPQQHHSDSTQHTVLIIGPSGTVGQEVVRALLERRAAIRVLIRAPGRVAALPAHVERVVGDVRDRSSLARAMRGVASVLYVSPHEPDEVALCENVVAACEAAGARLVFVGVHADGHNRLARAVMRWVVGRLAPHYGGKLRAAEHARRSRTRPVMLCPANFAQNDELFREELLAGRFPSPFSGLGMNRVDVRDVGDAAARALLDLSLPSGAYPVSGPATLNGPQCAAVWGEALGCPVRYTGDDGEWVRLVEARLGGQKRLDFVNSLRLCARFEQATNPRDVARTTALLGRAPRTYGDFVRDTAARWRAAAAA
jgi:uncharacterized protein YbjT (DUF2867 family)